MSAAHGVSLLARVTASPLNYWGTLVMDALCAAGFGWFGIQRYTGSAVLALLLVVIGVVAWTLVEYLLHRCVLHGWPPAARQEHARHHGRPRALIATPLLLIPLLALLAFGALALVTSLGAAALVTFGLYAGYNYFVAVHHLQHFHPDVLARSRMLARNLRLHELHHRHPEAHFGISTSLWDRVFRSTLS